MLIREAVISSGYRSVNYRCLGCVDFVDVCVENKPLTRDDDFHPKSARPNSGRDWHKRRDAGVYFEYEDFLTFVFESNVGNSTMPVSRTT